MWNRLFKKTWLRVGTFIHQNIHFLLSPTIPRNATFYTTFLFNKCVRISLDFFPRHNQIWKMYAYLFDSAIFIFLNKKMNEHSCYSKPSALFSGPKLLFELMWAMCVVCGGKSFALFGWQPRRVKRHSFFRIYISITHASFFFVVKSE